MYEQPHGHGQSAEHLGMQQRAGSLRNRISLLHEKTRGQLPASGLPVRPPVGELANMTNPCATIDVTTMIVHEHGRDIALPAVSICVCGDNEIGEAIFTDYVLAFDDSGNWVRRHSMAVTGVVTYKNGEEASTPRGDVAGWHDGEYSIGLHPAITAIGDDSLRAISEGLVDTSIDGDRLQQMADLMDDLERHFA